jgi:Phage gp6-like head-tail connector protein
MAFGDLCALGDVKAWLNLTTSADDALLSRLITAASQYIQQWLNRPIPLADYVETRDGLSGALGPRESRFAFGVQPCQAVSVVIVDGVTIPPVPIPGLVAAGSGAAMGAGTPPAPPGQAVSSFYTQSAGYLFTLSELVIRGYPVPRKAGCVFMQYTAGYAATPPDLAQACIELVAQRYRARGRIGEVSRRIGPEAAQYSQLDMPTAIKTLIQRYRLMAPIFARTPQLAATATDAATVAAALS